jgi:predicted O-linked N-acetylglucosamine transferase (SPINDLY family)
MQPEAARLFNEGCRRAAEGDWRRARRAFEACAALEPRWGEAQYAFGVSLRMTGEPARAMEAFVRAAGSADAEPDWFLHCAEAQAECGEADEALRTLRRGAALFPDARGAALARRAAAIAGGAGRLAESVRWWKRARAWEPDSIAAANNEAMALLKAGRQREALARLERLAARADCPPHIHSNLLLCSLLVPNLSPARIFALHRGWAEKHERGAPRAPRRPAPPARGRIRIGYVSPSFSDHSVAYFMRPVLEHHDRSRFAVHCYSEWGAPQAGNVAWRSLRGVGADEAASLIARDRIHILVDLAGHALGNRMDVFARRPAPVQCTYLGHAATTGLDSISYCFADSNTDPPGMTERHHSEKLIRLNPCFAAYQPPPDAPAPSRKPGGAFTFGCFGGLHKINAPLIRLWARILLLAPGSRLLVKGRAFGDAETAARFRQRFERLGVDPARIVTLPYSASRAEHLASYAAVDVALDTFPYAGTTTTCEALWMGVPVVTLAGRTHVSRLGVSLLSQAGLWQWIARDEDGYARIAAAAADGGVNTARRRAELRRRMDRSPLLDGRGFCRRLERAYLEITRG